MQEDTTVVRSIGCATTVGKEPGAQKTNQDMIFVEPLLGTSKQAMFGVLDGHGHDGIVLFPCTNGRPRRDIPVGLAHHESTCVQAISLLSKEHGP